MIQVIERRREPNGETSPSNSDSLSGDAYVSQAHYGLPHPTPPFAQKRGVGPRLSRFPWCETLLLMLVAYPRRIQSGCGNARQSARCYNLLYGMQVSVTSYSSLIVDEDRDLH